MSAMRCWPLSYGRLSQVELLSPFWLAFVVCRACVLSYGRLSQVRARNKVWIVTGYGELWETATMQ